MAVPVTLEWMTLRRSGNKEIIMIIKEVLKENYDMEDDEYMKATMADSRRPRLTLRHLNKLRKLKDIRRLEAQERQEFVKVMYASGGGGGEAEGGGF